MNENKNSDTPQIPLGEPLNPPDGFFEKLEEDMQKAGEPWQLAACHASGLWGTNGIE